MILCKNRLRRRTGAAALRWKGKSMDNVKIVWTFMLDYTKGWGVRRHQHDYLQMYYCMSGEGVLYLDGQDLRLKKDDCLIIKPHQIHELYPMPEGQLRIIDTKFYVLDERLYQLILEAPSIISIADDAFRDLQQNMRGEWVSGAPHSSPLAALLFEQSLYLYLRRGMSVSPEIPLFSSIEQKTAQFTGVEKKIADYLAEHYWEIVTLDRLANELRYSKNYLCKVFKAAAGMTISEYSNFLKVRKAYGLVCYTDARISEIARACGFSSIHYFSRTFRKYVGMAPSQLRSRDRNILDSDIRRHGKFQYRYYSAE